MEQRISQLEAQMYKHAQDLEFEAAARVRDELQEIRSQLIVNSHFFFALWGALVRSVTRVTYLCMPRAAFTCRLPTTQSILKIDFVEIRETKG